MAGRPLLRKLTERIEEEGGDHVVFDCIAAGATMDGIAQVYAVSRQMIYAWIHEGGDKREKAWRFAKKQSAHALVDEAKEILDEPAEATISSAQVSLRKDRAGFRRWLAGCRNQEYRDQPTAAANINLNIGEMHLSALQRHGTPAPPALEGGEILVEEITAAQEDFEILPPVVEEA